MTESEWNKGDEEYEGLSFINDPFTLRRSEPGQLVGAEVMFESQHEQTPEQSSPKGLIPNAPAQRIAFQRF
jgi:hypothetical protein